MTPTRPGDLSVREGRRRKAEQFAMAASVFVDDATQGVEVDLRDAYITLAVHAGIAAADTICLATLGEYAPTGSHAESISTLRQADPEAARHLSRLLGLKTKAGYGHQASPAADVVAATRAHLALINRMRMLV